MLDALLRKLNCGRAQATSALVRRALAHVRSAHAHFNESNGADHVMVFSYDHARCDLAPGLRLAEWGQLVSIQSYGDLTTTYAASTPTLPYLLASQAAQPAERPHSGVFHTLLWQSDRRMRRRLLLASQAVRHAELPSNFLASTQKCRLQLTPAKYRINALASHIPTATAPLGASGPMP